MAGRPEVAASIKLSLDRGEFFLAESDNEPVVLPDQPPVQGPGSNKAAWDRFALAHSDFDPEVIEKTKAGDLIVMLKANGIIE
jgi:hypothetical protein